MKEADLKQILNGDVLHINEVDMHEATDPKITVIVSPLDVKKMLISFLNSEISAELLNKWSEFLCFRTGEYVCNNDMDDVDEDYYEDMWYVIQKLSTPEIDGEITPERVREYLKELDKYFTNETKSANDEFQE